MIMRKYQIVAICWSLVNFWLASYLPIKDPFPWLRVVLIAVIPLTLIFFPKQLATNLRFGFIQYFASDRNDPQPLLVIMFMGWIVLVLETTALLVLLV